MPVLATSSFSGAPAWQFNGHLQTIIPSAWRRVPGVAFERERIDLADGDFLDLDWLDNGSRKLIVLSHGLEGSSRAHYMKGMAKIFATQGWDVLAWNFRSCSGEINRALKFYGYDSNDLEAVIAHAMRTRHYEQINLVGFSMGASVVLKFLGRYGAQLPAPVVNAVVFAPQCDLASAAWQMDHRPSLRIYRQKFLQRMAWKFHQKARLYPEILDTGKIDATKTWMEFSAAFVAPTLGFNSVESFLRAGSCTQDLAGIRIPTLMVSAQNDPLLTRACFPVKQAEKHPYLLLEMPRQGGHIGFQSRESRQWMWSEHRALRFVQEEARALAPRRVTMAVAGTKAVSV